MKSITRFLVLYFLILFFPAQADFKEDCEDYFEGNYKKVAKSLKKTAESGNPQALQYYADICRNRLDGEPHTYLEAAIYYVTAALLGNSDMLSWLNSIDPKIIKIENLEEQATLLTRYWELEEFLANFKTLKVDSLNNYLAFKNVEIDCTKYLKTPYFLELLVKGMIAKTFLNPTLSFLKDEDVFSQEINIEITDTNINSDKREIEPNYSICFNSLYKGSCSFSLKDRDIFITFPRAWGYGIVYTSNYSIIKNKMNKDRVLPKPDKVSIKSPFYIFVADVIADFIREEKSGDLGSNTHQNLAWVRAGLAYFKEDYFPKENDYTLKNIEDFLAHPEKSLDSEKLQRVIEFLESSDRKWPNEKTSDRTFRSDLKGEFFSKRLLEAPITNDLVTTFFKKANFLEIDMDKEKDIDFLKEGGFILQLCSKIKINNIKSNKSNFEALYEAIPHLGFLKKLYWKKDKKFEKNNFGKKIDDLLSFLKNEVICYS